MCEECGWSATLDRIMFAQDRLSALDGNEAAEEFVESVGEKLDSMMAWISERSHATPAQQKAIENMIAGIEKWLR